MSANGTETPAKDPWLVIDRGGVLLRCVGIGGVLAVDMYTDGSHTGGLALTRADLAAMTRELGDAE